MNLKISRIMEIGQKIRKLRKEKGLLQKELANKTGMTQNMIHRYEVGLSNITIPKLESISRVFGIHLSYFFTDWVPYPENKPKELTDYLCIVGGSYFITDYNSKDELMVKIWSSIDYFTELPEKP